MDFQGIHDRLRAIGAPGLVEADEPRPADPEDKKDKGRSGEPFVVVEPQHWSTSSRSAATTSACSLRAPGGSTSRRRSGPEGRREPLDQRAAALGASTPAPGDQVLELPKASPAAAQRRPAYRAAQWHERECAEMYGITFVGHPDPRNILLPDDWVGHPMRKDYEFPKEYHGISCE